MRVIALFFFLGFVPLFCSEPNWTIKAIKFSAFTLGKSSYLQEYPLSVGQEFTEEKHEQALKTFTNNFRKKGFKACTCSAEIKKKKIKNQVTIILNCKRGPHFSISTVDCTLPESEEYTYLKTKLTKRAIKQLVGKKYDEELLLETSQLLKTYLEKKGFLSSKIKLQEAVDFENGTVAIYFTISFGPQKKISFFGNNFYNSKCLIDTIARFKESIGILPHSLLEEDIKSQYFAKGFWNSTVEIKEEEKDIHFIIQEGPRSALTSVLFKGNNYYCEKKLLSQFFTPKVLGDYFDADRINQACDAMLDWYKQQGFWDVIILKKKYIPQEEHNYQLQLLLDEGKQYYIKTITIPDFPELTHKGPFYTFSNQTSSVIFDKYILSEQKEWLITHFKKQGYPLITCTPELQYDEHSENNNQQLVTIIWHINTGPRVTFGNLTLEGTTDLSLKTVTTITGIKTGMAYSTETLQLAAERLRATQVFNSLRITPITTQDPAIRDIIITAHDDDPFEIRARLGFAQVSKNFALKKGSTYKAGGTFLWKNITHHADLIQIDADFTRFERKCTVGYQVPISLFIPAVLSFKGYSNNYSQPLAAGSNRTLYRVTQDGIMTSITSQARHYSTGMTTGFEWMETKDISANLAETINFKTDLIAKKVPYFFCEPSIFIDLLDNKLNPTKGLFIAASAKGMFPLKSDSYFIKILVEKGLFFPLFKHSKIVCAVRTRFGHIFKTDFTKIMPPERFYLGGANSLRGYLPDACPPLGTFIDNHGTVQRIPQGGKSMVNLNFELRIPTINKIDLVLFQDFGVLVPDIATIYSGQNSLAATGCGIRYNTSLGPVRFDIGFKWQKPFPEDTRYAWYLTFGHAF